ncbi:MAG: Rubrerythrin [Firmicutes bacterium]|nr:Rubrerythrin [Bacillota bacterium]
MSLLGITKGTDLENEVERYLKAESQGVVMYYGLARLAAEKGLDDVADLLIKLAGDEARHAGLYAVLNGHINQDIIAVLTHAAKAETAGREQINALANKARSLGFDEAACEIEVAAEDEGRHGIVLEALLKKHLLVSDK